MIPKMYQVKSVVEETYDTFTLTLCHNGEKAPPFMPGQFNMLYLFGYGEVPISISGDPTKKETTLHTIRAVGAVTQAMQRLQKGDEIGVRGPFGTHWPLAKQGGDILVIAGGLGLAGLRSALCSLTAHRDQYNKITLLYGAGTPADIIYKKELQEWQKQGVTVEISVDKATEEWKGQVGVVTTMIQRHIYLPQNTRVLICGPEIMIQSAINELLRTTINHDDIFISMERNMHCATGFCGHCLYGPYFLCKDGPVFSYEQLKKWLPIREL